MKRLLYILLFFLLSITAFAQRAPITVTTILTPPYTTSLSTMAESGSTRLMVNLLVNDVTITEIPVKLHIKMESSGITIESIPTQAVRPMFLGGGEARVLTGDDFAEYLRLDNLNFKGFSKEAYIKNGQLPAGLWKFSVSVRHFYTNKTISNIGTVTAWITSYKPPVLTTPKDGDIAPSNAALPLTFSWQASKHTGGTAAIMYRFEMWERRVEGVPAQAVAASVPPIYTTETAGLTATVLPATLALEPGMKYCWRVTAYDPSGMVTIENNGESEVRTFQYLEKCPEVCGLTIDIKDDTGYASWEENRVHLGGYNFEFYDDEGTCHKTLWGSSNKTAGIGGEYGKTWHVRVQGLCRSGVEGPWSDWVDFTIPEAFKPLKDENGNTYECGREVPERVITNFELIDNIQKGDTLEDERGTTKYIIHSATKNEDGSFRGLSYMKLSFWGVKVLGEYNNMKVNTDGVIIGRYAWKSVKSDLLVADPEAIEKWADELALEMAGATYNNTIKDTIVLEYSKGYVNFETIEREGGKYYAVKSDGTKEEITSMINGKTRALVKDGDGHELVIDKDGNVMGVEEYKKCGGSKALLRENIKEKDSQVTKSGNVKFFSAGKYLFDTYDDYTNAAKGYAERFPSIGEGDYRPAYACAESNTKIEIKAEPYANITFKNERGVPLICKGGILEVTARGDRDTTSIYAYDADNHIVGKVNVLSYDKVTRKICLVPIGDTKAPDASVVKQGLDEIFAKLMVDFDVTIGEPIAIQYAKDNIFTHGGSGMIGVYNTDQKAAISKLKERGIDNETVYLFFVKECNALKANDSPDVVNGYMPRGYQFGFIYNQTSNTRTIAHELCHGAFHLKHTFDATDYLAPEGETNNLMDYTEGQPTTLNHWQWKDIHQPKSVRFKWLQDEEGAESIFVTNTIEAYLKQIHDANAENAELLSIAKIVGYEEQKDIMLGDKKLSYISIGDVINDLPNDPTYINGITISYSNEKTTIKPSEIFEVEIIKNGVERYTKFTFHYAEQKTPMIDVEVSDDIVFELMVKSSEADILKDYLFTNWEYLMTKDRLTAAQIAIARDGISKVTDEKKRGDLFEALQEKVEYHNQMDNKTMPYVTCNQTSLAMAFEMLGVSKDDFIEAIEKNEINAIKVELTDEEKNRDFEDVLELIRDKSNLGDRTAYDTWKKLAEIVGITSSTEYVSSSKKSKAKVSKIKSYLKKGCGIVVSLFNYKGHIVRLQNIDEQGIIIDDPYGKLQNLAVRDLGNTRYSELNGGYSKHVNNTHSNSTMYGENDLITWEDLDVSIYTTRGGSIESESEDKFKVSPNKASITFITWWNDSHRVGKSEYGEPRQVKTEKRDEDGKVIKDNNGNVIYEEKSYYKSQGAVIKIYMIFDK